MTDCASDAPALEAAIQWAVRLAAGNASEADFREFLDWKAAAVEHQLAWGSIEQQLHVFSSAREHDGGTAHRVLAATRVSRRKLLRDALATVAVIGIVGAAVRRAGLFDTLSADVATDVGARRQLSLVDNSTLVLDARSAVDIDFGERERAIRLLRGQMFVRVARDPSRPLVVYTRDGSFSALGTAFSVGLSSDGSRLAVTHSAVRARSTSGAALDVVASQVATIRADAQPVIERWQADSEVTWMKGYVTIVDRPLRAVVESLNRYVRGFISISDDVAALKISGLFPLDDAQMAIRQIAQTLPVVVTYHTDYFIRITAR